MSRPTPAVVTAEACASALAALACSRENIALPGLVGKGARLCLDEDRQTALARLSDLAAASITEPVVWQVTTDGANLLAANIREGHDRTMAKHAGRMRAWAAAQPMPTEDPSPRRCVLCGGMAPGMKGAYRDGPGDGPHMPLCDACFSMHDACSQVRDRFAAERTAYPNGKPGAPRGDVAAPATPASPPPVAEAAQAHTVGERCALTWWDGQPNGHLNLDRLGGMIDAAIREAAADATRAADVHVREVEAERDSLRADVATLTEERAKLIRERDGHMAAAQKATERRDILRRKISQERTDNAAAWARVANVVTYEARRLPIADVLDGEKG